MPRASNLEVKVGMVVAGALICLTAFIFSISDFSAFRKGDAWQVLFRYADGLKKGAPVRLAGVDAGHIRAIKARFDPATRVTTVVADIWIEAGHSIPVDSHFMINQLGLLGEKYIEIIPGASPDLWPPGTAITGEDPVPMESLMKTVGSLGSQIGTTLNGINTGILTAANTAALGASLANIAAVTGTIKDGQGTVGKFLSDPVIFKNLDEMTADLKANPWKLFYRPKK